MLETSDTEPSDSDDIIGDRTPTFTGTVRDPLAGLPAGSLPPGVVIPPLPGVIGSLLGAKPKPSTYRMALVLPPGDRDQQPVDAAGKDGGNGDRDDPGGQNLPDHAKVQGR